MIELRVSDAEGVKFSMQQQSVVDISVQSFSHTTKSVAQALFLQNL